MPTACRLSLKVTRQKALAGRRFPICDRPPKGWLGEDDPAAWEFSRCRHRAAAKHRQVGPYFAERGVPKLRQRYEMTIWSPTQCSEQLDVGQAQVGEHAVEDEPARREHAGQSPLRLPLAYAIVTDHDSRSNPSA